MKALVLEENGRLVWREHELRRVDGWYRMRIAAAGICGSDLGRGFKGGAYHYPLVMGHEFSAVVEEAPAGGKYTLGTLAAVYPLLPCGKCTACAKGWIQLCEHYDYFGSRRDGAFAEELYVPESHILSVPAGVTEAISVDMGCVGEGLSCTEKQVSICAKDSGGPYSYDVVKKLIAAAKKEEADFAVDVYPHYGSDVEATLQAGYDIRHGLIGAGVYASHGYERSHKDGVKNALLVLKGYLEV